MPLRTKLIKPLLILLLALFVASCSKFNKVLKSGTVDEKYEAAMKYYNKKDFYRAGLLFDDLLPLVRGTARSEEVYYHYAYSKYYQYEISVAAFHFRNFYETYPTSKYAEECFYMYAYCNYLEAYPANLDQTYTYKAIQEFQLFVNIYPHSQYVQKCNELIDECRKRLQTKAYNNAKLYYKIEDYKAAAVAFKNLVREYPDLGEAEKEEAEFLIIKASYKYAEESIEGKQEERFNDVIKAYKSYQEQYPNGMYLKEAAEYAGRATGRITEINNQRKTKAYNTARHYYRSGEYRAAVDAFRQVLKDYPDMDKADKEEAQFLIIKSAYKFAEQSPPANQVALFQEVITEYNSYQEQYPNGEYLKKAAGYSTKATEEINKLNKGNTTE
ncbi:MAG TPA: outer membrane protein assembly factor BamD [Bacteroidia bacterium]|nr:outer membrane protein assembly factor BamD [Bacteroidia bacterium]